MPPSKIRRIAKGVRATLTRAIGGRRSRAVAAKRVTSVPGPRASVAATPSSGVLTNILAKPPAVPVHNIRERLQTIAEEVEVRETAAFHDCHVSQAQLHALQLRLDAGAVETAKAHRSNRRQHIILGLDIGTSSTKAVARFPYLAGEPTFAVRVPPFARAEGHPHLWASCLWLGPRGRFSLTPLNNGGLLCGVKANLMDKVTPRNREIMRAGRSSATAEEAATAFLALHIRQARGWLWETQPNLLNRGPLVWHFHIGFPAASLDVDELCSRYRKCLASAIVLAHDGGPLRLDAVKDTLCQVAKRAPVFKDCEFALVPEIAAAIAGYARSPEATPGLFVLIDIGAGTLDCSAFNLYDAGKALRQASMEDPSCPLMDARVELLGVNPWKLCQENSSLSEEFETEVRRLLQEVIWRTKRQRYPLSDRWRTGLPVFLTGGGANCTLYRQVAEGLNAWLGHHQRGGAGVRVLALPEPTHSANTDGDPCAPRVQRRGPVRRSDKHGGNENGSRVSCFMAGVAACDSARGCHPCSASGVVGWDANCPERGMHSVGTARFQLRIDNGLIVSENGSVLTSHAESVEQQKASVTQAYADRRGSNTSSGFVSLPEGSYREGAVFWAAHRSDKPQPTCADGFPDWLAGCLAARSRLSPIDVRRRTEKEFRWGWNSL
jgi:hypothetical protein